MPPVRCVVAMGTYNDAQYLDESIPAVLKQTRSDIGVLLLDNGSTDDSRAILKRYYREDRRIRLLFANKNLTAPEAANFGWNMAMELWPSCQWFMGLGADDRADPDYVEAVLMASASDEKINCVFSPARFIGRPDLGTYVYPTYRADEAHLRLMVPGWRAFTRTLWLQNGPEYTGINQGSDWEWIVRASKKGLLHPYQLPRSYLARRIRTDRISESDLTDKPALHARLRAVMRGDDA